MPESRETSLWRAVIERTLLDATAEVRGVAVVTRKGRQRSQEEIRRTMFEAERERDAARRWLLGNSTDFRLVCDFAGFDPDDARENAERLAAARWKMTEDARGRRPIKTIVVRTAQDSGGDAVQKTKPSKGNSNV